MPDLLDVFVGEVHGRLRTLASHPPTRQVVSAIARVVYYSSFATEEGRFVRANVTFANSTKPDPRPPSLLRANYPTFSRLATPVPLTVRNLVKLARAIDPWSSSIAVYGPTPSRIEVWGMVDQLVGQSVSLYRETEGGFVNPGCLTIVTDTVGGLSAFHGTVFLGSIRAAEVVVAENDALLSPHVAVRIVPQIAPIARAMATVLGVRVTDMRQRLFDEWSTTVARLCIGLRRLGTGGSLLITPTPDVKLLKIGYELEYSRLGDAMVLKVLDEAYTREARKVYSRPNEALVPRDAAWEALVAEVDETDRREELAGAVKAATSLASVDGLLLLTPSLSVKGFGVKIQNAPVLNRVFDGASLMPGRKPREVDISRFGTRHTSMLRYCSADATAIGVVVSQDGQVRVMATHGRKVVLWDSVKLLGYEPYSRRRALLRRKRAAKSRAVRRVAAPQRGYSSSPKTVPELFIASERMAAKRRVHRGERP